MKRQNYKTITPIPYAGKFYDNVPALSEALGIYREYIYHQLKDKPRLKAATSGEEIIARRKAFDALDHGKPGEYQEWKIRADAEMKKWKELRNSKDY
jgi:hypothetical protein